MDSRDIDQAIRGMAGRAPDRPAGTMTTNTDDMIRRMAGRSTSQPEGYADDATEDQRAAAALAGLPAHHAHRLTGEGRALVDDARALVETLREHGHEPTPPVSFDGGPRQPPPQRAPVDAALRAAARSVRDQRGVLTVGEDMFIFRRNDA